jgi:hypothetical protein
VPVTSDNIAKVRYLDKSTSQNDKIHVHSMTMDRKTKGRLAEAKVFAYLIENEYELYLPLSDNSKYDAIAVKEKVVKRISIKFSSVKKPSGSWIVEMRQIYRGNKIINVNKFENDTCDLIAVYLGPIDKVVIVESSLATGRSLLIKKNLI